MFRETAERIRKVLALLPLDGAVIVNLGSSTREFYQDRQPWIWSDVMEPLAERASEFVNVDAKGGDGVDFTSIPDGIQADLILCCSMLEHVEDPYAELDLIRCALKPDGLLLLDVPAEYPHHPDPIDNGLRVKSHVDFEELLVDGWDCQYFEVVTSATGSAALGLARKV